MQDSPMMDQANISRPSISHPYPPSYRSQLSSASLPPNQSYTFDYQQRREERHNQNPPLYPTTTTTTMDTEITGQKRPRSFAGIRFSKSPNGGGEYPEGWSEEDEEAEREFMRKGMFDWEEMRSWKFWIRKEWWGYYLALVLIAVLVTLMTIYHDQIVTWLKPAADWMKDLPGGFMIPIVILFVISFPPLFGHEIVIIIVGLVWGLWWGFLITSIGTFLGEVGNFFAFKYCCRSRAEKYERENMSYATLAHVVREGGFFIVFVARLSAIPGHFTTAVFSTCGVNIWVFSLAAILTLPKQLVVVYLGVIFGQDASTSTKNRIISYTVLGVGFLATCLSAWYIYHKMNQARIVVWRRQRMALSAKGSSTDPEIGLNRSRFQEYPVTTDKVEDIEAGTPILTPYQTYQNPYEMHYRSTDNISVDDVDQTQPLRPAGESDLGYGYRPADSVERFPQPQPSGGMAVQRAATSASTWTAGGEPIEYAEFPEPTPLSSSRGGYVRATGGSGVEDTRSGGYV
ncbi:snare associated Golgi protein-domain-containing protein [Naematelia encephala]|uniref:Golgi apparatus membrane protein TVP38 n=1 Tax=Naematelia encephala TaxID=71784 RepID=A0A1Y2BAH3_9TREE|nr:snare associated Golgi protein-domain-containing protein [Naematelia encephala]